MNKIHFRTTLAFLLCAVVSAGCENPVEEHQDIDPDGIVIRAGATEVIRVVGLANPVITGSLTVPEGGQSPLLTATYTDSEGDDITLDTSEYWLGVISASTATATWQATAEGAFTGRVSGGQDGTTTLGFQLAHGPLGGGHPVEGGAYIVPVTVTATQP